MSAWRTFSLLSLSCSVSPPAGVLPVEPFAVDRYLGTWYEIARLDHPFERGLDHVTAQYILRSDGSIKVINSGFSAAKQRWKQSIGKARFLGSPQTASLKVSFSVPSTAAITLSPWMKVTVMRWLPDRAVIICGFYRARQCWMHR